MNVRKMGIVLLSSIMLCSCGGSDTVENNTQTNESVSVKQEEKTDQQVSSTDNSKEYKELKKENDGLTQQVKNLSLEIDSFKKRIKQAEEKYSSLEKEYKEYKNKMLEYENLGKEEAEARRIEANRIIEEEKVAKEQKEAEEKAKKEAKEKEKYNSGTTYEQLSRNPDDNVGAYVKFTGTVLQALEDDSSIDIRLAVDGNSDKTVYCVYYKKDLPSRILEDDTITVYGQSTGLISYNTVLGSKITIPGILVDKIDTYLSPELVTTSDGYGTQVYSDNMLNIYYYGMTTNGILFWFENKTESTLEVYTNTITINGIGSSDAHAYKGNNEIAAKSISKYIVKCDDFDISTKASKVGAAFLILIDGKVSNSKNIKFYDVEVQ